MDNFNRIKSQQTGSVLLTSEQLQWVELMKKSMHEKPKVAFTPPTGSLQSKVYSFIFVDYQNAFEATVVALIVLNTIVLNLPASSAEMNTGLETVNIILLCLFTVEMLLKVFALRLREYLRSHWNKLDLSLVLLGWVGYLVSLGSLASLFRLFRVLRILKVLAMSTKLKAIITTFLISIPSIINVGALFVLILIIFAIVFMNLFGTVKQGVFLDTNANFESFWNSMNTLVRISTGESFNGIMHDLMVAEPYCSEGYIAYGNDGFRQGNNCGDFILAPLLFVSYFLISSYVMLSLITAIVLDNFSESLLAAKSKLSEKNIENFKDVWGKFDPECTNFIDESILRELIRHLKYPLGVKGAKSKLSLRKNANRLLSRLNVKVLNGKISFNDTLVELIKVAMQSSTANEIAVPEDSDVPNSKTFMREISKDILKSKNSVIQRLGTQLALQGLEVKVEAFDSGKKAAASILQASMRGFMHRKRLQQLVQSVKQRSLNSTLLKNSEQGS